MHNGLLFLILLSAHLLGDYYLQSKGLANKKEQYYSGILTHSLIYALSFVLVYLIVDLPWWLLAIAAAAHWVIDSIKWLLRDKPIPKPTLFLLDQTLHLLTLLLLALFTATVGLRPWLAGLSDELWTWLTIILLIWKPCNVSLDILFEKFALAAKEESKRQDFDAALKRQNLEFTDAAQLPDQQKGVQPEPVEVEGAGAWVGTLERLITILFASLGQFAAMGLLMAAKSMARYDKISKGSAFAEYYLIGTLYSILFAIAAYLIIFKVILPTPSPVLPTPILLVTPTPLP